jgi:hypothetical protein
MSFSSRVSRLRPSCSGNRRGQSPLGMTGIGPMSPPPAWCLCDIIQSEDREALPGSSTGRGSFMNIRGISDVYGLGELEAAGSALIKAHERGHDLDEWGPIIGERMRIARCRLCGGCVGGWCGSFARPARRPGALAVTPSPLTVRQGLGRDRGPSFAGVGHHRRRSAMYSSLTWRQPARAAAGVRDSHSALACTSLS